MPNLSRPFDIAKKADFHLLSSEAEPTTTPYTAHPPAIATHAALTAPQGRKSPIQIQKQIEHLGARPLSLSRQQRLRAPSAKYPSRTSNTISLPTHHKHAPKKNKTSSLPASPKGTNPLRYTVSTVQCLPSSRNPARCTCNRCKDHIFAFILCIMYVLGHCMNSKYEKIGATVRFLDWIGLDWISLYIYYKCVL